MTSSESNDTGSAPRKARLYCPECAHASPPEGDWQVTERETETVYRCPQCGTDLTPHGHRRRVVA